MRLTDTEEFIAQTGCIYNPKGVVCTQHDRCSTCGWNPEVSKKINQIKEDNDETVH